MSLINPKLGVTDTGKALESKINPELGQKEPTHNEVWNSVVEAVPEKIAEEKTLAKQLSMDPLTVQANPAGAKHAAKKPNFEALRDTHPVLYEQLKNPAFAALVKDDVQKLSEIEELIRRDSEVPELTVERLGAKAVASGKQSVADFAKANSAYWDGIDITDPEDQKKALRTMTVGDKPIYGQRLQEHIDAGEDPEMAKALALRDLKQYHQGYWQDIADDPELQIPPHLRKSSGLVEDVVAAMSGSALGMGLSAISPPTGTAFFFNQMYGAKYRELQEKGVDEDTANKAAMISALGQAPLESAGSLLQIGVAKKFLTGIAKKVGFKLTAEGAIKEVGKQGIGAFIKEVGQAIGVSAVGEGFEEYLQAFPDMAADLLVHNPNATVSDLTVQFIENIPETAMSKEAAYSALVGALSGAGFTGGAITVGTPVALVQQRAKANALKAKLEELQKTFTSLEELDREEFEKYVEQVAGDTGMEQIFFQGDVLLEQLASTGQNIETWASRMGVTPEQIREAGATGQDLGISSGKVIASLKDDDVIKGLVDEMKVRPDDVSFNQIGVRGEENEAATVRLRELHAETVRAEATPEQITAIEEQISTAAKEAGITGYTQENVKRQAAVIFGGAKSWASRMSEATGKDFNIEDFFDMFNLSVGEPVAPIAEEVAEGGQVVFRGGGEAIDVTRGGGLGISVTTSRETAELFTDPDQEVVGEAFLPDTANILLDNDIPKDLLSDYLSSAKELEGLSLSSPQETFTRLQSEVKSKQKTIVDYARENGFDGVEIKFEDEIRIVRPSVLRPTTETDTDILLQEVSPKRDKKIIAIQAPLGEVAGLSPTFETQNVTEDVLPESPRGLLPSKAEGGQYYNATAEQLQSYLDETGDGFLYRVTDQQAIDQGFDHGLKDYKHQFKTETVKVHSFTTSYEDAVSVLEDREPGVNFIYRVAPQDLSTDFAVQIPSEGGGQFVHVQSPFPAGTASARVVYRNGQPTKETADESRQILEESRRERGLEERAGITRAEEGLRADVRRERRVLEQPLERTVVIVEGNISPRVEFSQAPNNLWFDVHIDGGFVGRWETTDAAISDLKENPTYAELFGEAVGPQPKLILDVEDITLSGEEQYSTEEEVAGHNTKAEILNLLEEGENLSEDVMFAMRGIDVTKWDESLIEEFMESAGDRRTVNEVYEDHLDNVQQDGIEDTALESFDPETDIEEWAILGLGLTDDLNEAGYILSDGRLLDLSGKNQGGPAGSRSLDHRQLPIPIKGEISGTDLMIAFQEEAGAIRMDAQSGLIDMEVKPTSKQMDMIEDVFHHVGSLVVSLQDGSRRSEFEVENFEKLPGVIKRFYRGQDVDIDVLFQEQRMKKVGVKGSITFKDGDETLGAAIQFTENADLSTFLHESGHFFLEVLRQTALQHGVMAEEWETVKEFLGATDDKPLTTEQHEKWAESFERYLAEGKAPSRELQSAFDKFKTWLVGIYREMSSVPGSELSDEVRAVMDKLVATDDEINEARAEAGLFSILDDTAKQKLGETDPELLDYLETMGLTDEQAARALDLYKLQDLKSRLKEYKEQAEREWQKLPSTRAIKYAITIGGIGRDDFIEAFGQEAYGDMPKVPGFIKIEADGQITALAREQEVTEQEMVDILLEHENKSDFVERRSEELEVEYLEGMTGEDALHRATSLKDQLAQESALLARLAQRRRVLENRQIRAFAEEIVSKMTAKDARNISKTITALRRSRLAANKAVKDEDYAKAFEHNEKARLNEAIVQAQTRAKDNLTKISNRWGRIIKSMKKNPGNYDSDYRDQVARLIARFELSKTGMQVEADIPLFSFFEKLNANLAPTFEEMLDLTAGTHGTYEWLYDEIKHAGNWQTLSYQELQDIDDLMVYLNKNGRVDKKDFLTDGETRIDDVVEELLVYTAELKGKKKIDVFDPLKKAKKFARKYGAEHIPLQYFLARMDGYDTSFGGKNIQYLFDPLSKASADEHLIIKEMHTELLPVIKELHTSAKKHPRILTHAPTPEQFTNPNNSDEVTHWTFDKVISFALNFGNKDNLQKLIDGYEMTYDDALQVVSILTKEDWQNIQAIWNSVDTLWPETARVHKVLNGFTPKKVKSEPFVLETEQGPVVLQGGYYPLKYDPKFSSRQEQQNEKSDILQSQDAIYGSTKTPQGFTEARMETAGGKPVWLSMGVLTDHISAVAHHVTHAIPLTDIDKITRNKEYRDSVVKNFGKDMADLIRPSLAHIANPKTGGVRLSIDELLDKERMRAAGFILWYNVTVAAKQPFSIFNLAQAMGGSVAATKYIMPEVVKMTNPIHWAELYKTVNSLSPNMDRRAKAIDRELQKPENFGAVRRLSGKETVSQALDKFSDATGPALIRLMDLSAAYPGWMAAYKQGLDKFHGDADKAISYADKVISATQPFDRALDQSAVRRTKGMARFWTMFTGYTNKFANRRSFYYEGFKAYISTRGKTGIGPAEFVSHAVLERVAPSLLMSLMIGWIMHDESPEAEDYLVDLLMFQFAGRIGLQDAVAAMVAVTRKDAFRRETFATPLSSGADLVVRQVEGIAKSYKKGDESEAILEAMWKMFEYYKKIPVSRAVAKAERIAEAHD